MSIRIPKIRYVNWHKEYPQSKGNCWRSWFSFERYWSGQLVYITIKHHSLTLDFRRDWWHDLMHKEPT